VVQETIEAQDTKVHEMTEAQDTEVHEMTEAQDTKVHEMTEAQDTKVHEMTEAQDTKVHEMTEAQDTKVHEMTEAQDTVALDLIEVQKIIDAEKHTKQLVVTVEKNVKYHSNQNMTDQFIAKIVSKITNPKKVGVALDLIEVQVMVETTEAQDTIKAHLDSKKTVLQFTVETILERQNIRQRMRNTIKKILGIIILIILIRFILL